MTFDLLQLAQPILRALADEGYAIPTPIQAKAIPPVLAGRDVLGSAQTGTGKTAAFALPILHRLITPRTGTAAPAPVAGKIRVLVLSPTRELANQINESFRAYGRHTNLKYSVVFGGVNQNPQVRAIRAGLDVLIATPGRLLDLMNQGFVDLRHVEVLVLDEADQMLDMGFIHDIRRIITKMPAQRQNLLFSATMPREIRELANTILRNPESVQVAPASATADKVEHAVYFVEKRNKPHLLTHYINSNAITRTLVFTRTKHGADRVAKHLERGGIRAEAIHGNKSQNRRERTLSAFKSSRPPVLVATDVAARGLDIDEVSHVINFDVPNVPETYVHRIGRTARAGASGVAVSFCDGEERSYLKAIERLTRLQIVVKTDHPPFPAQGDEPREQGGRDGQRTRDPQSSRDARSAPHTPTYRTGGPNGTHHPRVAPSPHRTPAPQGGGPRHHAHHAHAAPAKPSYGSGRPNAHAMHRQSNHQGRSPHAPGSRFGGGRRQRRGA